MMKKMIAIATFLFLAGCSHEAVQNNETSHTAPPESRPEGVDVPENDPDPLFVSIFEGEGSSIPSEDALEKYEAARLGALYLEDVLGIDTKNMYFRMMYADWDSHLRPYWLGHAAHRYEDFAEADIAFSFILDAVSGTRVNLGNYVDGLDFSLMMDREAILEQPFPEDTELYLKAAGHYASLHFKDSEIVELTLDEEFIGSSLRFYAVDATGRSAFISLQRGTGRLQRLETDHNDWNSAMNTGSGGVG